MDNCNSPIAAATRPNLASNGNNDAEEHCSSWVGIDLGTTNSCVAVWRNGQVEVIANAEGHNLTPSCVSFMPGEPEPIVGYCAKQQRFSNPESTIFEMKRLFGRDFNDPFVQNMNDRWAIKIVDDGHGKPAVELESGGNIRHIRPVDIQSLVLGKMRATAERHLGRTVTKAVITIPAYFNSDAKAETMEAARLAGFEEGAIQLLHEPTAAAYYYGYCARKYNDYRLLVFDLGGGTFDVTILHVLNTVFLEKGIDGINNLGGQDFDWAMFELAVRKIREQFGPSRNVLRDKGTGPYLWAQCQQCKERLSSCSQARLDVSEVFADLDGMVIIEREEYEKCIRPLVESAMEKVRRLLMDCKMQAKEVNEVLLVGGSTRLPLVQEMLKREFGNIHLNMSVNTDEAVACGAAMYAAKQCENVRDGIPYMMSIIEANPLKLGVSGKDGRCYVLIERNTPLPAVGRMRFILKHITESSVSTFVRIYEGERLLEQGNRVLGTLMLDDLEPNEHGEIINMVQFELDKQGLLTATYSNMHDYRNEHTLKIDYRKLQTNREESGRKLEEAEQNRIVDEKENKRLEAKNELEEAIREIQYRYYDNEYDDEKIAEHRLAQCVNMECWLAQNQGAKSVSFKAKLRQFRRQTDDYCYAAQINPYSSDSSSAGEEEEEFSDGWDDDDEDGGAVVRVTNKIVGVDGIQQEEEEEEAMNDGGSNKKKPRMG